MGVIHDETGTEVIVKNDNQVAIDELINTIQSDPILSEVLSPAIDKLKDDKKSINDGTNEFADAISEQLRSYEEQVIYMKGTVDTHQMVNTIFVEPKSEARYEVGATALSEYGFPYPVVVDGGSKFYDGKPFVLPAIEMIDTDLDGMFETTIMSNLGG